LYKGKDLTDIK